MNSKIGYYYHRIDNVYDIVEVNYDGLNGREISNIHSESFEGDYRVIQNTFKECRRRFIIG
jgi:hypothetical protein